MQTETMADDPRSAADLHAAAVAAVARLQERSGRSLDEVLVSVRRDLEAAKPARVETCPACGAPDDRCLCF